jgi:hypothetical protein
VPDSNSSEPGVRTKEELLEVLTFLFLIVPSMALSFYAIRQGIIGFVLTAVATILRDLALVSLILYFLWRNREDVSRIGWTLRGAGREAAIGLGLSVALFYVAGIVELAFRRAGLSAPATPTPAFLSVRGGPEVVLAFRGRGDDLPRVSHPSFPKRHREHTGGPFAVRRNFRAWARL